MNQRMTKPHSRVLFYSLLAVLLGLCFIRNALQVNIPSQLLLAVALLMALLGDRDELIALCLCCIPLHTSLNAAYVLLFALLMCLVKFSGTIRFNLTIVPVLLMLLWELVHSFGEPFSPVSFVGISMPLLLLAVVMCCRKGLDYDFLVRTLAVSIAAMCLSLLGRLVYLSNFNLAIALEGLRRLGLDSEETQGTLAVTDGQLNPNTLGILCVLAITGLMQLRNSGRSKGGDGALILFLLVFGALTSSRTYLACLAIMVVLLILAQKGTASDKFKLIGSLLLVLLAALLVLYLFFPELLEFYYRRFLAEDITTGRADLMTVYHDFIVSDPKILLFGVGLMGFEQKVLEVYRVSALVPHNGIQELVIAWGIPGLLMFAMLWIAMILRGRELARKQTLLHFIPLLVLLAKVQVGQMLNSSYTMMAFTYAFLSLSADITPGTYIPKQKKAT